MIITAILRAVQIIFCVIVLGLSVNLIRGQEQGNAPAQSGFEAFCGGLGLLVAVIGIAALFVTALQGIIVAALDGFAALVTLVGGIVYAASLKVNSCSDQLYLVYNDIIRGWTDYFQGYPRFINDSQKDPDLNPLVSRCHMAQAVTAFLFFAFAAFAATAALHLTGRGGGRRSTIV